MRSDEPDSLTVRVPSCLINLQPRNRIGTAFEKVEQLLESRQGKIIRQGGRTALPYGSHKPGDHDPPSRWGSTRFEVNLL